MLLPFLNKSIWLDEGASLYSARLGWSALWHESLVVDRVLLPYYAFLHFWLDLSHSIEWVRVPSLIAFGLTVYFVGLLAQRAGGFWCGLLAAVLTCTNPLMITAALDARPYALATLASVLSVTALLKWFDRGDFRCLWIFSLLAVAVLLLQLFTVLAPLGALGACILLKPQEFRRHWRRLMPPIALLAVVGVVFLALVARQQGQVAWITGLNPRLFVQDLEGPASSTRSIYPVLIVVIGLLSAAVCALGWRKHSLELSRFVVDRVLVFLSWAAVPTVILVLITIVKPVYVSRYITVSVPGMAIALALLITYALRALAVSSSLPKQTVLGAVAIVGVVILVVYSISVARTPGEDLKSASQYILRHVGPTSEVAVPGQFLTTGVEYYLDRADPPPRLWPQMSDKRFNDGVDLRDGERTFAVASRNVWLLEEATGSGASGFISKLKSHGFVRVNSKSYYGVLVIHFHR